MRLWIALPALCLAVGLAAPTASAAPTRNASFGKALHFDGTGGYVDFSPNASGLMEGTVEFWLDDQTSGNAYGIFCGGIGLPGSNGDYFCIGRHGSTVGLAGGPWAGIWRWADTGQPSPGGWTHIAYTWGPEGLKLYVNGDLAAELGYTSAMPTYAHELLGASTWGAGFVGAVDDLRVWNQARSEAEIESTMTAPLPAALYQSASSGVVAYYPFDAMEDLGVNDDGPDDLRDLTPNANHGDASGGVLLTPGAVQVESASWSKVKSLFSTP